ncbi:MAG: HEPN domain-containing protein [Candidatus Aminicenantes bacterium]|nr:HEPN domain-containing protein [Candidatus Aminicenantes bacterium]
MDIEKQVEYWKKSAAHDLETAESLIKEKKFDWALFLGHLVLEKMLKSIFVKKKEKFPPKTHNLLLLIQETGIIIDDDDTDFFEEVNTFNISTRYPDEQFKFYQLCTEKFTREKFDKIKEKYQWLKKMK